MDFKVTEGLVAALMLAGLEEPPEANGFSKDSLNSYFAQDGVDVSLVWMDAGLHTRMMQQHHANLAEPQQVTVERIGEVMLGEAPVTEVVYYKSRPVPDPDNPEVVVQGREATWQYIWPGDDGQSHALLTIWRSGVDEMQKLEAGFAEMRGRWQAGPALPGVLYDLRGRVEGSRLVLTGVAVSAPQVPWGRIIVPAFHGYDTWGVEIAPWSDGSLRLSETVVLEIPGTDAAEDLEAQLTVVEGWVTQWSPVFGAVQAHAKTAAAAFAEAVETETEEADLSGGVSLRDVAMTFEGDALELRFVSDRQDGGTHEGAVQINAQGDVTEAHVDW